MSDTRARIVEARQRILVAGGAALLVAGVILVMFILPAEYAVDPLGTGARVGLLDLGITGQQIDALSAAEGESPAVAAVNVAQDREFQRETVEFTLAPFEGMEYKYRLERGEALLYAWSATGPVNYELHGEPDGAPRGYADSYEMGTDATGKTGTFTAPTPGIHGWYWENPSADTLTVTLSTAGFYNLSHEFRADAPVKNKTF